MYVCSVSQATVAAGGTHDVGRTAAPGLKQPAILDPIVGQLTESHRFAVTSLWSVEATATLISGDVSGEVFFRSRANGVGDMDEPPWQVLRMPIRLRKHVSGTRDGRCLMSAGPDGALELCRYVADTSMALLLC